MLFLDQIDALALEIRLSAGLLLGVAENSAGSIQHGLLSIGNLDRVQVQILGDWLDGLDALERFERNPSLEFRCVLLYLAFILV